MRALAIVHQPDAGPGVFAEALAAKGVELDRWLIADAPAPADPWGYDAVLTFGGAMHTDHEADHPWLREEKSILADLIERRVPLLGMCLGCQLVAEAAGAKPRRASAPEIGWDEVELTPEAAGDPLLGGLPGALLGVPVAQLRGAAPARSHRARPEPGLPAGLPARGPGVGHPVPRGGEHGGRRLLDQRLPQRPRRGADRARPGGTACRDAGGDRRVERRRTRHVRAVGRRYSGVR